MYYLIDVTEYEIMKIDKEVFRNREVVCRFITKLPSSITRKTKKVSIVFCLRFILVMYNQLRLSA